MRNRLFWKFFLAYVLIGIASFILIATLGSKMVENSLVETSSRRLYRKRIKSPLPRTPFTSRMPKLWRISMTISRPWPCTRTLRSGS